MPRELRQTYENEFTKEEIEIVVEALRRYSLSSDVAANNDLYLKTFRLYQLFQEHHRDIESLIKWFNEYEKFKEMEEE